MTCSSGTLQLFPAEQSSFHHHGEESVASLRRRFIFNLLLLFLIAPDSGPVVVGFTSLFLLAGGQLRVKSVFIGRLWFWLDAAE